MLLSSCFLLVSSAGEAAPKRSASSSAKKAPAAQAASDAPLADPPVPRLQPTKECAEAKPSPTTSGPANPQFEEARALFTNFQFDEIIPKLQAALAVPGVTNEQKVEIYKLMAFTYTSLEQPQDAQDAFIKILEVQEDSKLVSGASPRFLAAFSGAQKLFRARKPVKLKHEPPQADDKTTSTSVDVVAIEGLDRIDALMVHYRLKGSSRGFQQIPMTKGDDGAFSARVPTVYPGPAGRKTVEYFIRAREKSGAMIASIGEEAKPHQMLIETTELRVPTPLHKNWLFWGAVGVVAAGAAVVIPVASRRDVEVSPGTLGSERLGFSNR